MPSIIKNGYSYESSPTRLISDNETSTNSYVSMGSARIEDFSKMTIYLRETGGANDVLFKIDVSMDNANWINVKAEDTLSASEKHYETLSDVWHYVRVQIKSAVAGSHGTVQWTILGAKTK